MPDNSHPSIETDERYASLLVEIQQAEEQGQTIDVQGYLDRYPDLGEPLRDYFRDREWFARVAPRLAPTAPQGPAPGPPPEFPPGGRFGGYEILGEVGRGGMGVVYRVSDPELNRSLAVKVLRPELMDEPGAVHRFLEEAQVTGQLQHLGVVPVHAIGRLPDGRPYLVMKLVQGRTLTELLGERRAPGQDLPRFLGIFRQVCEAVAYAHSKGVIHRDLKPANVMVGAFGEVQVMDWGLAKVFSVDSASRGTCGDESGQSARRDHDTIRTVRTEGAGLSSDGLVVGTFGYMSPEQAKGQGEPLDPRADVFGLGAMLCEVLTALPPYAGVPVWQLPLAAAAADLAAARARLDRCGAEAELIALARDCLAAERTGRPRDAGAVAARVAAYQAAVQERLRQAELARAAAEARAVEERKRRRVTLALAAALLLLIAGGGGGLWWTQQRRQATDAGVARLMGEANLLYEQAQRDPLTEGRKFDEASETAQKARQLADDAGASVALRREAVALAEKLEAEAKAAARDRVLLAALLEVRGPREETTFRRDERGLLVALPEPSADEQFQAAFRAWGLDVDATPVAEAAARLKGRPAAVVTEVIAALDEWTSERRWQKRPQAEWRRLAYLARAVDDSPDPRRRELRALLTRDRLTWERGLSALSAALRPVPIPFDVGWGEDRGRLRRLAAEVNPAAEPVLGILMLAQALHEAGESADAERLVRAAVRARPREVVLYGNLGNFLTGQPSPRWAEAAECYAVVRALRPGGFGEPLANALVQSGRVKEGLALYERLVTEQPENPWLYLRRAEALDDVGRYQEEEEVLDAALRVKHDYAEVYNQRGVLREHQGQYGLADSEFRTALNLKPDFLAARINYGGVAYAQGRVREAEAACREALLLKPDCPEAHYNLGVALYAQGFVREAESAYRDALRFRPDYPDALDNLGLVLYDLNRLEEAEAAYRAALRLRPDGPLSHCNLGRVLFQQGRLTEALVESRRGHALGSRQPSWPHPSAELVRHCERFIELDRKLPAVLRGEAEPASPDERLELAYLCQRPYKGRHAHAARLYADAFAADPKIPADLQRQLLYNAACSAAFASAGQGEGARHLPDKEQQMLRRQALTWLRADLAAWSAYLGIPQARATVEKTLQHWQADPDLAGVRDKAALAKLPAAEREAWVKLWADVETLRKRVRERK